jgi:MoaA/NifB/PqqE/SkfB family radical SAM enzyme
MATATAIKTDPRANAKDSGKTFNHFDFKLYQHQHGHPDFDDCYEQAQALAAEILPGLAKDSDMTRSDKMQLTMRKARSMAKAAENLIINRRRYARGDHGLRPLYVIWTMLNACNFRCTYCDNHQGEQYFDIPDPNRLSTEQGKQLLEVMRTGTSAIYWCGGEPTMRKDLPELLDHACDLGYYPNMINTNGSLIHQRLADPQWNKFLRQMDIIIVSLDALNTSKLHKLWGVKKAKQVMINLLLLRELRKQVNFKLAVNTVITPDTIDEARAVFDLACDLDIWFVPVPVNFKHEPNRQLIDNDKYRELSELIIARKKKGYKVIGSPTLLKRLLYAEPYQCLTALKPHVWSNGEICWPCRASANVKPVEINLLDYNSFDEAYEAGRKLINPNFFHGPGKNQCGGQCSWMQNYTTSRYLDGITNPISSGFISELKEFAFNSRVPRLP